MKKDLIIKTFRNTLGAVVYIFAVSQLMQNGSAIFGPEDNLMMPFVFLLLFSFSAAVVGGLVLGQSVVLFLDGKKAESIRAAVYSIAWLGIFTIFGIGLLVLMR